MTETIEDWKENKWLNRKTCTSIHDTGSKRGPLWNKLLIETYVESVLPIQSWHDRYRNGMIR